MGVGSGDLAPRTGLAPSTGCIVWGRSGALGCTNIDAGGPEAAHCVLEGAGPSGGTGDMAAARVATTGLVGAEAVVGGSLDAVGALDACGGGPDASRRVPEVVGVYMPVWVTWHLLGSFPLVWGMAFTSFGLP